MAPTNKGDVKTYNIMCIADMDKDASDTDSIKTWKSLLRRGTLTYNSTTFEVTANFQSAANTNKPHVLKSSYNYGGRGMELSDLVHFNNKLYTVCDKTGIVYEICDEKMIPWLVLSTGDGRQEKGFKGEWMTVKDGLLYIGGHGRDFYNREVTEVTHKDYRWVKTVSSDGAVSHHNWDDQFTLMQNKAGCPRPGYLTHESGCWSDVHKSWFFLPRKASAEIYNYKMDEQRGTNLLIKCSEDFSDIQVTTVGELKDKKRGFSAFKFIPGTNDNVIVAIRSEECDGVCKTHLVVFNINGKILLEDETVSDTNKYEGIEFEK